MSNDPSFHVQQEEVQHTERIVCQAMHVDGAQHLEAAQQAQANASHIFMHPAATAHVTPVGSAPTFKAPLGPFVAENWT